MRVARAGRPATDLPGLRRKLAGSAAGVVLEARLDAAAAAGSSPTPSRAPRQRLAARVAAALLDDDDDVDSGSGDDDEAQDGDGAHAAAMAASDSEEERRENAPLERAVDRAPNEAHRRVRLSSPGPHSRRR